MFETGFAQYKNFNSENEIWRDGTIELMSGEVLSTSFNYNFVTDIIKIKEGEVEKILTSDAVWKFNFNGDSTYYSLPNHALKSNLVFYKLIYEGKNYSVLSKDVLTTKQTQFYLVAIGGSVDRVPAVVNQESVTRIIFVMDSEGKISPFMKGYLSNDLTLRTSSKIKYSDKKKEGKTMSSKKVNDYRRISYYRLKDIFKNQSKELRSYKRQNKLVFYNLSHLVSLVEYIDYKSN